MIVLHIVYGCSSKFVFFKPNPIFFVGLKFALYHFIVVVSLSCTAIATKLLGVIFLYFVKYHSLRD